MSSPPASPEARWARWSVRLDEASDGRPLCLSLANTLHFRNGDAPREILSSYADLVKWAVVKAIVTRVEGDALEGEAAAHPHLATAELRRAVALREAIARLFAAFARGRAHAAMDLAEVVSSFNESARLLKLEVLDGRLVPAMPGAQERLELPRWQAALSAVGLMGSEALRHVKQCADDRGCGWLFLDATRNGSRQFCFSSECGNRARQAKFRARHRTAPDEHRR